MPTMSLSKNLNMKTLKLLYRFVCLDCMAFGADTAIIKPVI